MFDAEGGCLCGAIRYKVSGQTYHRTHCHCTLCRRSSGAPFVTWFSVANGGFRVVRGETVLYRSSAKAVRGFCGRCGTQLTFQHDDTPGEVDVTMCSLDDPNALTPDDHIFTRSRLLWVVLGDGLPAHAAAREPAHP